MLTNVANRMFEIKYLYEKHVPLLIKKNDFFDWLFHITWL